MRITGNRDVAHAFFYQEGQNYRKSYRVTANLKMILSSVMGLRLEENTKQMPERIFSCILMKV